MILRKALLLVLGEQDLAVDDDIELARRPRDELRVDARLLLDLGRETRGARLVVSGLAVLDRDVHERRFLMMSDRERKRVLHG